MCVDIVIAGRFIIFYLENKCRWRPVYANSATCGNHAPLKSRPWTVPSPHESWPRLRARWVRHLQGWVTTSASTASTIRCPPTRNVDNGSERQQSGVDTRTWSNPGGPSSMISHWAERRSRARIDAKYPISTSKSSRTMRGRSYSRNRPSSRHAGMKKKALSSTRNSWNRTWLRSRQPETTSETS